MPVPLVERFRQLVREPPWLKVQKFPRTQVGLEAGPSSVKAVRVVQTAPAEFRLAQVAAAASIEPLLQEMPLSSVPVNVAVGGAGTVVRWASFPRMNSQELRTALSFEAEKYIPFKLDEVYLDSCSVFEPASGSMEVLLAAARKEVVEEQRKRLAEAGITPAVIDLEPLALANAAEIDSRFPRTGVVALVHGGRKGTLLDLFQDGRLRFVREFGAAGERAGWDEWLAECRRCFDFYENQHGQRVEKIWVTGEGATADGFLDWLKSAAGIGVEFWNPALGLVSDVDPAKLEKEGAGLGIVIGLAVRGAAP